MRAWASRFRTAILGTAPEQVAMVLLVGLVLGVFPVMGFPTIFCLLAAFGLRLNAPALQLVNNVTSPLQLALLVPLERVGAQLCGGGEDAGASAAAKLGAAALHAIVGWACIFLPAGILLYAVLLLAMRKRRLSWCNSMESPA